MRRKSVAKKHIPLTKKAIAQHSKLSMPSNRKGNAEKEASPSKEIADPSKIATGKRNIDTSKASPSKENAEISKRYRRKKNKEPSKSIDKKRTRSRSRLVDEDILKREFLVGDKPDHFGLKEFSMMTGLNCGAKPNKEVMKKVMDDGEAFCDKVCQSSKTGMDAELLLKQLKSKSFDTVESAMTSKVVPLPLPRMLRWHKKKVTSDPDLDPFKQRVDDPDVEGHPYLISILPDMDMDYMKNLIPYDDEVADPIIDQLAVDLEWVTAIKKAPGAVSLEINDEDDNDDDDPLCGCIPGSPLVSYFSDIGRGGPCRMCNAQPSDTDMPGELKVMNEKLDKVLKILGEMKNQNEILSKVVESP
ncbi:hypothetical protein A4A49_23594 [Nicotiana attenuata]|uniref:Uncharacterized protein n=1 Tax=Nicotiana attenuata TaxID=49451 RepID=A0A1J6L926_NICAT|nr:hypothetical protein A4A49_23594 [Nicotiana attenuata]